jgi:hypothetical protein
MIRAKGTHSRMHRSGLLDVVISNSCPILQQLMSSAWRLHVCCRYSKHLHVASSIFPCGFGHQLLTRDAFGQKLLTCSAHNWRRVAILGAYRIAEFAEHNQLLARNYKRCPPAERFGQTLLTSTIGAARQLGFLGVTGTTRLPRRGNGRRPASAMPTLWPGFTGSILNSSVFRRLGTPTPQ